MVYYSDGKITVRDLEERDPEIFAAAEREQGWQEDGSKLRTRLDDAASGRAVCLAADFCGEPAGYVCVYPKYEHGAFAGRMPMIVDFAVLEKFRRLGVGGKLMDVAEDIAAAVGFKSTTTGDTICDEQHPVILESMEFPEPVIELAIEPKTKDGQTKMGEALTKLAEEDPTFRAHTDPETGQTIIAGMGELHLEIIVDRLLREFKVEANVGAPQVAYKETFTSKVDVESKYAKQSGGRGQYGHCKVIFEPMDPNGEETFKFESTVVGGNIPKEYIPAVGEGIEEAAQAGILGGFPVLGVHATVYDGSYHEVDSSDMAFHIAGSMAFKDAMKKAGAVLLEPIMRVEVTMPEEYMGDVIGDINSRRGRIEGMDDLGGGKMVKAYVPLAEMFGYSTDLRSKTQGRGNYSMFFEKYEQVPKSVQEKVLSAKNNN